MNSPVFSVLMPVYAGERPGNLQTALNSVFEQTAPPDEVVIVEDGLLTAELRAVLSGLEKQFPGRIHTVPLPKQDELGAVLAAGVPACRHALIARMDSDDICCPTRFEQQLQAFAQHEDLDIVGGQMSEFEEEPDQLSGTRRVPLEHGDILRYARKRNPFNHMTVMFKKTSVLAAGNYQPMPGAEDYWLWARMLAGGCTSMNLDECLVLARTGPNFMRRRHGWAYFKEMLAARKQVHQLGLSGKWAYIQACVGLFALCLAPFPLKRLLYRTRLRTPEHE